MALPEYDSERSVILLGIDGRRKEKTREYTHSHTGLNTGVVQ
jgi:hypothetical protein